MFQISPRTLTMQWSPSPDVTNEIDTWTCSGDTKSGCVWR